ncbi:hypothetical protein [Pseudoxanthomonas taiwanensis]|uniref:Uncharacterized protein n=1 Tax=Pseudoxanthomonas taiwanensis TaxID=176598 RepID=A0A921NTW5_9GAMM|nr:hypothetical protein [Pseudoxanthomonas taiwanensis]KAF1689211.1 hypothetical protein CR938_06725 [Pseudoxanthomonas taiwanensis]
MSIVLYVGGSKDGSRGVVPHGFTRCMLETEQGREIYVERLLRLPQVGTVRVMALEQLAERLLARDVARHYGVA